MLTVEINEADAAFHNERDNLARVLGREMETEEGWVNKEKDPIKNQQHQKEWRKLSLKVCFSSEAN